MFYRLAEPDTNTFNADWASEMETTSNRNVCPKYGEAHRVSNLEYDELLIQLPSANVKDFVWIWGGDLMITNGVLTIFRDSGLTGFEVRPVTIAKVKRKSDKPIPKLWEFIVTGDGGDADPVSGIRLMYKCEHCNYMEFHSYQDNGIVVDPKNWDGSDFFTVVGYPKFILVSEKVTEVVEKNRLKGCIFIPSNELRHDDYFKTHDISLMAGIDKIGKYEPVFKDYEEYLKDAKKRAK